MSRSKPFIIGSLLAATSVAVYGAYCLYTKQNSEEEEGTDSNKALSPSKKDGNAESSEKPSSVKISAEKLAVILDAVVTQMNAIIVQLASIEQKIRSEQTRSPEEISESEIQGYLLGQFEEAMKAIEVQIYAKHECTEDEVSEATNYYSELKVPQVLEQIEKIQGFYNLLSGTPESGVKTEVPDDLTLEKFIAIMAETMKRLNESLVSIGQAVQEDSTVTNKREELHRRYIIITENIADEVNRQFAVNKDEIQAALVKYNAEAEFISNMQQMQLAHQRILDEVTSKF